MHLDAYETALLEKIKQGVDITEKVDSTKAIEKVLAIMDGQISVENQENHQPVYPSWQPYADESVTLMVNSVTTTIKSNASGFIDEIQRTLKPLMANKCALLQRTIYVLEDENGQWKVGDEHNLWHSALPYNQLMPIVIDGLQQYDYQQSGYQIAFHGAALSWRSFNLLIPGVSGAGKTTLASAFSLQGAMPYTDEAITLDSAHQLIPIPIPFGIKHGSRPLIEKWQGSEIECTLWQRLDGRELQYWWPGQFSGKDENKTVVVIFPLYQPDSKFQINEVSLIQAITKMAEGGYHQADPYDSAVIPSLIDWLKTAIRIEVRYSDAYTAAKQIRDYLV